MSTSYDQSYARTSDFFGAAPERTLADSVNQLDSSRPILDVGCGQGRNTLYLARQGFAVEAMDPSSVAIDSVKEAAERERLKVTFHHGTYEGFGLHDEPRFGTVLVYGLIQVLTRIQIEDLIQHMERWTRPGGLAFVTAFTTDDAGYAARLSQQERWVPIGVGSLRGPDDETRTYLDPGELKVVLRRWELIHCVEELGPEHRHGDGPLERHALVEAVARKPKADWSLSQR